jgi:hypothetical protein
MPLDTQVAPQTNTPLIAKTNPIPKDHSYITMLPSYADRGKAIAGLMGKITSNPKYQALPAEHQERIRANFYKKYVVPSYAKYHMPVPDEKTWVGATAKSDAFGKQDYAQKGALTEFGYNVNIGVDRTIGNVEMFGTRLANKMFLGAYGLLDHFTANDQQLDPEKYRADLAKNEAAKRMAQMIDAQRAGIQDDDFWQQTHPAHTMLGKIGNFTGEQLATLPLYEALTSEKIAAQVGIPLTEKLAGSTIGKWVARRLVNAADGYMATLVASGGSKSQAAGGAVGFAAGAPLFEAAGAGVTKIASSPFIKKWTANTIAMAGKPFAEELAHSAAVEEEQAISHAAEPSSGEGLEQVKRATEVKGFMQETRAQSVRDWYAKQQLRAIEDPVNHKLHEGEKVSQNSISIQMYGKPLRGISKNQRSMVLAKRLSQIGEAAVEAPAHLPDLANDEAHATISKARSSNPDLDTRMKLYEQKFGAKFEDTEASNVVKKTKRQTGMRNSGGSAAKVAQAHADAAPKGNVVSLKSYTTARSDILAYLRAPRNRADLISALSDRSKAGFDKVYDILKKSNEKLPFRFEKPEQRLMYNYHLAKELDPTTGKALRRSILNQMSKIKGYDNLSPAVLKETVDKEAANLNAHIVTYTKTGKMYNGDNIYASTSLGDRPSWTKWQHQMHSEVAESTIANTEKALQNHPEVLKAFQSSIKLGKKIQSQITNPVEYEAYQNALREVGRVSKKMAKGQSTIIGK